MTGCKAACPHCGVDVWWVSQAELRRHIAACQQIEQGLFVEDVNSAVPAVDQKPPGFLWAGRDMNPEQ